jgi:hypothetical protein
MEGLPRVREIADRVRHEPIERLDPEGLRDPVAQKALGSLEGLRAVRVVGTFRLAPVLEGPGEDPIEDVVVDVHEADPDQLLDAARDDLEDVDVLIESRSRRLERLLEHSDAQGDAARLASVDAHRAQQHAEPGRGPAQRPEAHVLPLVHRDHALEEHAGQGLDAETQAHRLELLLAVTAVHAGDAHRDMALAIDLLVPLGRLLVGDDLLQAFEDREQDRERLFVTPAGESLAEPRDLLLVDGMEATHPLEQVVVMQGVLPPHQLPEPQEQLDLLAHDRRHLRLGELPAEGLCIPVGPVAEARFAHELRQRPVHRLELGAFRVEGLVERG